MIYGLEYLLIQLVCPRILKPDLKHHHYISESLHADPDRPVTQIRPASFLTRVEVVVDHFVQVSSDHLCHAVECVEFESAVIDKAGE